MTVPSLDRFQGVMLYSAVGDAMGWPTESVYTYANRGLQPFYEQPATHFVAWNKYVQELSGYAEPVRPGEYSDDTQLSLAVARCIGDDGQFGPEAFAYAELPLWLQYVRGGGKRSKVAARTFLRKKAEWNTNFYKTAIVDYTQIQTNGPVVRNVPVALANAGNEQRIMSNSFTNALVTHGHPRAILGAILYGLAVNYALMSSTTAIHSELIPYLYEYMQQIMPLISGSAKLNAWVERWDEQSHTSFWETFHKAEHEAMQYLERIATTPEYLAYYKFIGARYPLANWASGLTTVCAAIYLFLHYLEQPEKSVVTAADTFGSDTDTIAACVGALQGAYHGLSSPLMPLPLLSTVQDRDYLLRTAQRLHTIASGVEMSVSTPTSGCGREQVQQQILDWETSFFLPLCHNVDLAQILHPTLGSGTILEKWEQSLPQHGLRVKLTRVQFDGGQSCLFRSTIDQNGFIAESLKSELEANL